MNEKITVIGSYMTDVITYADAFPENGQAVFADNAVISSGGKGSNQAIAAHRLGADVCLISKLGNDIFADIALAFYRKEGINTTHVSKTEKAPTGIASVMVNNITGENRITTLTGANDFLCAQDVYKAEKEISESKVLLAQNEVPPRALLAAFEIAKKHNVITVFDPAPARKIPIEVLTAADYITPNQSEAEFFTGIKADTKDNAVKAANAFIAMGCKNVIITMGENGVVCWGAKGYNVLPAVKCKAVDTTGAGDAFNGALAVALAEGMHVTDAVEFANAAASVCVGKSGAARAMPNRMEADDIYLREYDTIK